MKKQQKDFIIKEIRPLTDNQFQTFEAFESGANLFLHGYAGTGKTFISLYLGLNEILTPKAMYDNVLIVRSVVPSRDVGFLPGTVSEKAEIYTLPYVDITSELFGRPDAYDILEQKGSISFETTSFLRGLTFNNKIVIVDEIQNMTFQELDTIMTRIGTNSRVIFCGDFRQSDLQEREKAGLQKFMKIINTMSGFVHIEFNKNDIVRSGIVKDYIIRKTEMGY